jgi:pimeloyl-ACP methyl ester carboxylesterase
MYSLQTNCLKRHKTLVIIITLFCVALAAHCNGKQEQIHKSATETITFQSLDSLSITADLYITHGKTVPFILLFHRAHWSRGEYQEIAPKLNELGFNCMAIDQRSGEEINGVVNQTALQADKLKKSKFYIAALPDLEVALYYVRDRWEPEKIIIWGSSYSAALVFYLSYKYPDDIDGIIAFSLGEYTTVDEKEVNYYAQFVKCPVFIASAADERNKWESIYENIPQSTGKSFFIPASGGKHGSEALWNKNPNHEQYWQALQTFLKKFL